MLFSSNNERTTQSNLFLPVNQTKPENEEAVNKIRLSSIDSSQRISDIDFELSLLKCPVDWEIAKSAFDESAQKALTNAPENGKWQGDIKLSGISFRDNLKCVFTGSRFEMTSFDEYLEIFLDARKRGVLHVYSKEKITENDFCKRVYGSYKGNLVDRYSGFMMASYRDFFKVNYSLDYWVFCTDYQGDYRGGVDYIIALKYKSDILVKSVGVGVPGYIDAERLDISLLYDGCQLACERLPLSKLDVPLSVQFQLQIWKYHTKRVIYH